MSDKYQDAIEFAIVALALALGISAVIVAGAYAHWLTS